MGEFVTQRYRKSNDVIIYTFFVNSQIINPKSDFGLYDEEPLKDCYYQLKYTYFLLKCCKNYPLLDKEFIESYLKNILKIETSIYKYNQYKVKFEMLANDITKKIY